MTSQKMNANEIKMEIFPDIDVITNEKSLLEGFFRMNYVLTFALGLTTLLSSLINVLQVFKTFPENLISQRFFCLK